MCNLQSMLQTSHLSNHDVREHFAAALYTDVANHVLFFLV
jgi:hypothetical protein